MNRTVAVLAPTVPPVPLGPGAPTPTSRTHEPHSYGPPLQARADENSGETMNRTVAGSEPEFSDAQVLGAISAALRAHDIEAVIGLLHVLAVQSPSEAQRILDIIEIAGWAKEVNP
jgi:hypothetical protein